MTDYEIDRAELLRLAELAKEYAWVHRNHHALTHYADGVRDTLRYLAGIKKARREVLMEIFEVNPDSTPRLVGE